VNILIRIAKAIGKGQIPADTNWKKYLHWPWIDDLRRQVGTESFDGVRALIESSNKDRRVLGIAVCKQMQFAVENRDSVRDLLQGVWDHWSDYDTKWWTMFRLFEYPDLATAKHLEAFIFVTRDHWKKWIKDCVNHFGGRERILCVIADRPGVASVAPSKSWSRILQTAGSHDRQAALALAHKIAQAQFSDPFVPEASAFVRSLSVTKRSPLAAAVRGLSKGEIRK
jgi:hypothetical protein